LLQTVFPQNVPTNPLYPSHWFKVKDFEKDLTFTQKINNEMFSNSKLKICQSLWINRHIHSFFKEAFLGFQIEGFCWVIVLSG